MRKCHGIGWLLAGLLMLLAGCSTFNTVQARLGSSVNFTAVQLQRALDRNFPKRYDGFGRLLSVSLEDPEISIPVTGNRLKLDVEIELNTLGQRNSDVSGHVMLTSGLRFDPATQGLHLQDPMIERLDIPALKNLTHAGALEILNAWLAQYAKQEPVYRLDARLLETLGPRRIGATAIEHGLVVVHLEP